MGYRSEVTIIIQASEVRKVHKLDEPTQEIDSSLKINEEKWAMFLAEVAVKPKTELAWREISSSINDDYGNTLELDKEKRRITMNFSDVKWYEGYENVDSHMALFHSVQPYEDYIDAVYLRIGENIEDSEEHNYGDGYDLASIARSIEIY